MGDGQEMFMIWLASAWTLVTMHISVEDSIQFHMTFLQMWPSYLSE